MDSPRSDHVFERLQAFDTLAVATTSDEALAFDLQQAFAWLAEPMELIGQARTLMDDVLAVTLSDCYKEGLFAGRWHADAREFTPRHLFSIPPATSLQGS